LIRLTYLLRADRANAAPNWSEKTGNATNYSHSLATAAICEAFAMTHGAKAGQPPATSLREAGQKGIDYLVQTQHREGGWRYQPKQAGDTSVGGWAFLALKTGELAKLRSSNPTYVR
jgi:hypothetical protein